MASPNDYFADVYIKTPCKNCVKETGRHPGCHSQCKKYKNYRANLDEKNEQVRKARADIYEPAIRKHTKKMRMKGAKNGEV